MEWRDEGTLLGVRRHGESSVIIEVLTSRQGRHAGLVRGGAGKTLGPVLQPGAQLSLEWNARLADHLGTFRVDLIRGRAAAIMSDRRALAALNAVSALLVRLLPEREPNPAVYASTLVLVDALGDPTGDATGDASGDALGAAARHWPARYAAWELTLLDALGFGLDLGSCAATGAREDLAYVSPRSGRAVSRAADAPYAGRMLPLPQFLLDGSAPPISQGCAALRLTGHFLEHRVCPAFELAELPGARIRLLRLLESHATPEVPAADGHDVPGQRPAGPLPLGAMG
jgi:DNA repair protein RecO (recombination protein O)